MMENNDTTLDVSGLTPFVRTTTPATEGTIIASPITLTDISISAAILPLGAGALTLEGNHENTIFVTPSKHPPPHSALPT